MSEDYDDDFDDDFYEGDISVGDDKMRLDIFSNYKYNSASWAIGYKTKEGTVFDHYEQRGCYGDMAGNSRYKGKELVSYSATMLVKESNKKHVLPYWAMLLDPKVSPWRNSLDLTNTVTVTHETSKTPHLTIPITQETSAQALVSFLIALRAGCEGSDYNLHMYNLLVSKGWSPHEALYGSIYMGCAAPEQKSKGIMPGFQYDWFAFNAHTDNVYKWLVDGTPRLDKDNTFSHRYNRLQDIWMEKDLNGNDRYGSTKAEFYKRITTIRDYNGIFPKRFKNDNASSTMALTSLPSIDQINEKKAEIFKDLVKEAA